jgi:hypothetical protein
VDHREHRGGISVHYEYNIRHNNFRNDIINLHAGRLLRILNGRRIYSFRAGGGAVLDYYDIAANTWVSGVTYSPNAETFTTGTKYALHGGLLYIMKENTGRWFAYDFARSELFPWSTTLYPQGAAIIGDTAFDVIYKDGATEIFYVYFLLNTSQVLLRQMVI